MMNITPQELGSYIVQSHGGHSVVPTSDYLYATSTGGASIGGLLQQVHHPLSVSSIGGGGGGGCASSRQSSDDDLSFYNNGPVAHPVTSSLSHSMGPFPGSEERNVTTSLYGLVTGATPLTVSSSGGATLVVNASPYHNLTPTLHHLHPLSVSVGSSSAATSPHHHPHSQSQPQHHPQQQQPHHHQPHPQPSHHHHTKIQHQQHSNRGGSRRHASSHKPSSSTSSNHSQQSYSHISTSGGGGGGLGHRVMTFDMRVDSSPSPFHNSHQTKHYSNHHHNHQSHHRKKKLPITKVESDDSETCSSRRTASPTDESSKKQNHSEIEKRRRDKMNTYISELSGMVPMCSAMSRKLDKLTVLRMAVQHMKTLRGSRVNSYTEGHYKPPCLTDQELKHLILQSAEGFLFVVGCDRGRLLYVSESVSQVLNFSQSDLLGQSWFDILHPKDVAKIKEQLSSSDLAPRERLIDAKTMLPVKGNVPQKANRLCPGARRSFFCRMKCRTGLVVKEESDSSSGCHRRKKTSNGERKYLVIHCTGYLKSWAKIGMDEGEGETDDPCNLSCLVAVGRILKPIMEPSGNPLHRPVTFISRHAIDGKFVFVDQRTTLVVGFLPQELLGTSMYEYFHQDDISSLADVHKAVLLTNDSLTTALYRFRTRDGNFVKLYSTWKVFRNPWTRDIEYIIAKNDLASEYTKSWTFKFSEELMDMDEECADDNFNRRELDLNESGTPRSGELYQPSGDYDFFSGNGTSGGGNGVANRDIQQLLNTHVPFRKIGEQIADEVTDIHRRSDTSSSNSPVSLLDSGQSSVQVGDLRLHQNQPPSPHPLTPLLPGTSVRASQQRAGVVQVSNQSNQAVVPQRQVTLQRNACSVSDGEISSTGVTGASQSERAAEGLSSLLSRTNDPVIGSAASGANTPTTNIASRLIRANGNNNNVLNGLENDPNVLNDNDEEMLYMIEDSVLPESPHQSSTGDGNDEAAMAVIMSLLEADAGLGGPVDFSGLPWPLP